MSSIMKMELPNTKLKYYEQWVEKTQDKTIQEYMTEQIDNKLLSLRKLDGHCDQRSISLKKGRYKGSCIWNSRANSYKICVRDAHTRIQYGFFPNLFSAERELQRLFEQEEDKLCLTVRKQQKYYQEQHRLTTRPKLTDYTKNISMISKNNMGVKLVFNKPFINPITKKKQKTLYWGKNWFKPFDKKQILKECVNLDDPVEIIKYREDLKQRLKEHKQRRGMTDDGRGGEIHM